jgi:glycosyltransferase involved in cell wall biosynthesis
MARRRGVPYLVTVHGMLGEWAMSQRGLKKRLYLRLRGRRFFHGAATVHTTAAGELEQARRWLGGAESVVLPYLFDARAFADLPGPHLAERELDLPPRDLPQVLFLSRLHEKKGVDRLILASAELRRRGVPHVLLIAGSGDPPTRQCSAPWRARTGRGTTSASSAWSPAR